MAVDHKIVESLEQEVANWTRFWIRKLSGLLDEFILPASDKPMHDLVEPGWLHEFPPPHNAILNYLLPPGGDGTTIVSLMNNPSLHGAWLASWHVSGNGAINNGRALWQPVGIRLAIDFDQRALILQQEWNNPRFVSNLLLGLWAPDSPDWAAIEFTAKQKLPFNLLLPADRASFDILSAGSGHQITFSEDTPLLLTRWHINQILFRGGDAGFAGVDNAASGTVH